MSGVRSRDGGSGVILFLNGFEEPDSCLERARALAQTLGQHLLIVRVLPPESLWSRLRRAVLRSGAPSLAEAHQATRRWLLRRLGRAGARLRLLVLTGDFLLTAACCASAARARLLVISPASPRVGRVAMSLAREGSVQVLIVRGKEHQAPVLAATDLEDPTLPVLRSAVEIAQLLRQPLVAVHNVDPLSIMAGRASTSMGTGLGGSPARGAQKSSTADASRAPALNACPILRAELDPVHAILDEAAVCEAGLIVVGARACSWWHRLTGGYTAARVASHADSSVLITPIP